MFERPDNWTLFVLVLSMAVWRVSHLGMYEAGPWKIVLHFRELFGVKHDSDTDKPIAWPDGSVFECFLCFSVWAAIIMAVVAWYAWIVAVVLAASAIAIWAEKWYGTR